MTRFSLPVLVGLVVGMAAPCTASTVGVYTGTIPPNANPLDNKVLWVLFAPQPEPPSLPHALGDSLMTLQYDTAIPVSSMEVGIAVEGVGLDWFGLQGGALGFGPASASDPAAYLAPFLDQHMGPTGVRPNPTPLVSMPAGVPAGMAWLWVDFDFCQPVPGAAGCDPSASLPTSMTINLRVLDANGDAVEMSPVPEPASFLLLGTGLVGLRRWRRRR